MCRENVLIERAQNFVRRGIQAEKALAEGVTPKMGCAKEQDQG